MTVPAPQWALSVVITAAVSQATPPVWALTQQDGTLLLFWLQTPNRLQITGPWYYEELRRFSARVRTIYLLNLCILSEPNDPLLPEEVDWRSQFLVETLRFCHRMEVVAGRLGKLWAATTDGPAPAVTMTKINFSIFKPEKKLIFNSLSWKYISDHQTLMCFEFTKQNLTNSAENVYSWRIEYFYIQKLSDRTREENWLLWLLEKSALQSLHSQALLSCFQNSAVLFQHFSCLFK